jgi:transposase-like protein
MRPTNIRCPHCKSFLYSVSGIGEATGELVCENPNCNSYFLDVKCPACGSIEKQIATQGLGDQFFTCKKCGNTWSSI